MYLPKVPAASIGVMGGIEISSQTSLTFVVPSQKPEEFGQDPKATTEGQEITFPPNSGAVSTSD